MKGRNFKVYFVIFFALSSMLFFAPRRIDETKTYYAYFVSLFLLILLIALGFKKPEKNKFSTPVLLLVVSALISGVSAAFIWKQGLVDSFKAITFFMSYTLFFLLIMWEMRTEEIEKIVLVLALTYMVIDLFCFAFYPRIIFGDISWYENRGFPRLRLSGVGFLFLFSFYSLSQYFQKRKTIWLISVIASLIFIILTLTRTYIAISFVFLSLYAFRKTKNIYKIGVAFVIGVVFLIISQQDFFKILSNQTVTETSNFENDIRVRSAEFYLFEFSPNTFARIFGNGVPYSGSTYFSYMRYVTRNQGLFQSDIGYIGLYSQYGILTILAYLLIIIKTIRTSVPDEYLYCKYFLYFIFVISVIISSTFSTSFIIPILLALYLLSVKDISRPQKNISAEIGKTELTK
jgi:hypothetical protein